MDIGLVGTHFKVLCLAWCCFGSLQKRNFWAVYGIDVKNHEEFGLLLISCNNCGLERQQLEDSTG